MAGNANSMKNYSKILFSILVAMMCTVSFAAEKPAGCDRNTEGVVDKSEEEILANVAHDSAAKSDGLFDASQVAFDQRNVGAFHRHVGAGAHGNPDVGRDERGCVVDPVSGHRHDVPSLAQLPNALVFVLRFDTSLNLIDAEFFCHGSCSTFVIPGEHDNFDSEPMKMLDHIQRRFLNRIRDRKDASAATINGDEDHGRSLRLKFSRLCFEFVHLADVFRLKKISFADEHELSIYLCANTTTCR